MARGNRKRTIQKTASSAAIGITLQVTGAALAAQAAERIAWHRRSAADKTAALKSLTSTDAMRLGPTESWTRDQKRRDLTDSIYGHQEHARFLEFVRRHLKRRHV